MSYFQPEFTSRSAPVRVRFGPGARNNIAEEIELLGASRALVLSTPQQSDTAMEFAEATGGLAAGIFEQLCITDGDGRLGREQAQDFDVDRGKGARDVGRDVQNSQI